MCKGFSRTWSSVRKTRSDLYDTSAVRRGYEKSCASLCNRRRAADEKELPALLRTRTAVVLCGMFLSLFSDSVPQRGNAAATAATATTVAAAAAATAAAAAVVTVFYIPRRVITWECVKRRGIRAINLYDTHTRQ